MYPYVNNSPTDYTDPTGEGIFGTIFGIIGSVVGGPLGGLIGFGAGNGVDAAIWSPSAVGVWGGPSVGGSIDFSKIGGVNDRPWNERLPAGIGTRPSINLGGVYGGGSKGPFIFTLEEQSGYQETWKDKATDWVAGAGDALTTIPFTTFSVTAWRRRITPGGDSTNTQSASYRVGGWFGTGYQMLLGTAVRGGTAAAVANGMD